MRSLIVMLLVLCFAASAAQAQVTVDRSSMTNKTLCGYQAWYTCPGDGSNFDWWHWSQTSGNPGTIGPGNYYFTMWPDTTEFNSSDKYVVPNTNMTYGSTPYLYSDFKQGTANVHFRWMQENQIDGVMLQRFISECPGDPNDWAQHVRDTALQNTMNAATTYGRVFLVEYDVSGADPATLYTRLTTDWNYLRNTFDVTNHGRYLYHNSRPVVALWGFGFNDRPFGPALAQQCIDWFKNQNCTVIGGVPWAWRTLTGNSYTDPAWNAVYRSYHFIQPWTTGAMSLWSDVAYYRDNVWGPDITTCNSLGIGYLPCIFPRFANQNLMHLPCGSQPYSPSRGGQLYWDQVYAIKAVGGQQFKITMFDEFPECTNICKVSNDYPTTDCWIGNDGMPNDWWLRLTNYAGKLARGEIGNSQTMPISPSSSPDNAAVVSDTIPISMNPGQQYSVSVTMRNTGETIWNEEFFRLGGVGDSDPFANARQNMSSGTRVAPNGTYTWNFTMTAPTTPGTYTTDWQIVHEYIRWFGAQLVKQVQVGGGGSPPGQASSPSPANSATGVSISAQLGWTAGSGATSHDVYFGTTSPGTFRGNQAGTTYNPGTLSYSTAYYWRIDEKNAYGTTTGVVWSFTTAAAPAGTGTLNVKSATTIHVDGSSSDWTLTDFTTKARAGQGQTGDYAVTGYDGTTLYYAGTDPTFSLPTGATDFAAKVYSRQDTVFLYFLVRVDDNDLRYPNATSANWANDCVEFYIDPSHDHGSSAMNNSTSDIQLIIDCNNQANVYMCTSGYASQVLNGVTSAVARDSSGYWLEARIAKKVLDPDISPNGGTIGMDFSFRDNDNYDGNPIFGEPAYSSMLSWNDNGNGGAFPTKIPDKWGNANLPNLGDFVMYNLSSDGIPIVADRMTHPITVGGDGETTPNTLSSRTGRKNVSSSNDYYFYFTVDDSWAYQGNRPDVYVNFTYYDSGTATMWIEYDSVAGGTFKVGPTVTMTNTNTWKSASLHLTDAYFGNRENDAADFRLFIGTGVTRTLDWIQTATVSSLKPWSIGCDLGNPDTNNGLALRANGDGDTTTATIGGRSCKRNLDSGNDYYMYFQASNLLCLEGSHPDLYVTFDYYDTGTGTIRLEYDGVSSAYQTGPTVTLANSNTWKQANMHVTDAYFANRQNNSSDFRLYLGTGVTRYIDAVTLRVGP